MSLVLLPQSKQNNLIIYEYNIIQPSQIRTPNVRANIFGSVEWDKIEKAILHIVYLSAPAAYYKIGSTKFNVWFSDYNKQTRTFKNVKLCKS